MIRVPLAFPLGTLVVYLVVSGLLSPADAQPASPRHIGVLLVGTTPDSRQVQGLTHGLQDAGYAEGRDVVFEWRSAKGDYKRVPELAAELVRHRVDVIVVESTIAAWEAKRATASIPIVMAIVADPL